MSNTTIKLTADRAQKIGDAFVLATSRYGETAAFIKAAADSEQLDLIGIAITPAAMITDAGKRKNALAAWKVQCNRIKNTDGTKRISFKVDGSTVDVQWQDVKTKDKAQQEAKANTDASDADDGDAAAEVTSITSPFKNTDEDVLFVLTYLKSRKAPANLLAQIEELLNG